MNHATTLGMLLDVARAKGAAPASYIRVHPSVARQISAESGVTALDSCGIKIELDESIPSFPGFAIVRGQA